MGNMIYNIFPNESFVDFNLYQYGWEQCDPLHSYGPSIRNHYLFHYVISGRGKLISTDSKGIAHEYQIKSGQGFLICPKQVNIYSADVEQPWEYAWVEFDGLRVKEMLHLTGLSFDSPLYRSNVKELSNELGKEMLYMAQHPKESSFHLIGHLYLVFDYMTRSSVNRVAPKEGKLSDFYMREAMSFIEQNFQKDITVEDISRFCNLNRSYFGKIFHDSLGVSPQQFLINYRMSKAAELLRLTKLSIREISIAVGYPNQLHFSRAFKNVYHVSPKQWQIDNKL
ncbi:MAG TPA: AraC family transcriptional regulator [Lachnospiraceae bacterium]|nr:AraC family transcriptional regulator [Lachnospiraceae bacterium]